MTITYIASIMKSMIDTINGETGETDETLTDSINSLIEFCKKEIVTDGLQIWFDGINNSGTGSQDSEATTWVDLSGNNNNGTIINGVWNENNLSFNGSSSWVNCGRHDYTTITIEALVTFNTIGSAYEEANSVSGNWESGGCGIQQRYSKHSFNINIGGTWYHLYGSNVIKGNMIHLTATYDGTTAKFYEDGVLISSLEKTGTIKAPSGSTVWGLGCNPRGTSLGNYPLNGYIYSARLYDKALSEEEVLSNYSYDSLCFNSNSAIELLSIENPILTSNSDLYAIAEKVISCIDKINEVTGESDETLTDAVHRLIPSAQVNNLFIDLATKAEDLRTNGTDSQYYSEMLENIGTFYDIMVNGIQYKTLLLDVLHTSDCGSTGEALTFAICGSESSVSGNNISIKPFGYSAASNDFASGAIHYACKNAISNSSVASLAKNCTIYYCKGATSAAQSVVTNSWIWSLNEVGKPDSGYHNLGTGNKFKLFTSENGSGTAYSVTLDSEFRTRTAPNNASDRSYTLTSSLGVNFGTSMTSTLGYIPLFSL